MDTNYSQTQKMDLAQTYHILVVEDPSFVREIQLDAATYSIGRHSSNDIVLSCQKTSRNHATLLRRTDVKTNQCSYWVLDGDLQGNRSRNGIYINGKKGLVHELHSGDVVHFSGDASVRYKTSTEPLKNSQQSNRGDLERITPRAAANRSPAISKETIVSENKTPQRTEKATDLAQQNSLAELSPQPIIEIDLYGNITYINSAGIINFKDIHHRKLNHPLLENLVSLYHQGHDNIITREIKVNQETFQQTAHYLPEKRVIRNYLTNISQQKIVENELQQVKTFCNRITEQIAEGIILVESATKQIVEANNGISQLLGYSQAELLQMNIYELVNESEKFALVLRNIIAEKNSFVGEYFLHHKNNNLIQSQIQISMLGDEANEQICFVIRNSGSTNLIDNIEQTSSELFKRELFNQQLLTAIANAKRSQKLLGILFCKLDFLPDINVTIGAKNYDKLLLALEKRLGTCLRSGDTVVRWQEDKFALLLPQVNDVEEISKISQRINQSTNQSFTLGQTKASIQSFTGIAVYPQDGTDPEILMASANTALERANLNKTNYQFYDEAMNSQALVALELETLLKQAIQRSEFELYYQPQINTNSGRTEAVEALLRWQHPELGLVAPGNFIRLAEKTKLIVPIGEWTIRTACQQNKQWQTEEMPASRIIVSLSLVQFQQSNLPQKIAEIIEETDFDANLLELEISAATLMDNVDYSRHLTSQLKSLGVKIAVDGFTTGFSTLEYLKQIPLDTLKIDRILIQQLTDSPQDLAIVTALIELGKGFNLRIVAEGVETQEQVELLRGLNCHHMQGYWFGRPLGASEAGKLLQLDDSSEGMMPSQSEAASEIETQLESSESSHPESNPE
ncbi:MAG: EAL domain-containing protein [Cyanobacteria bacterium P01_C01_bin.72]